MVERQDIDALLIGSLYGELSSAEEARLAAHLESHPADRTALADLTHARNVVRESRILTFQFEPRQSITAFLIQEAARRAPKARAEMSWFQRFMRSFLMHPAMAAAAMLVLIIGVAGTMYLKNGDHFANQTKEDPNAPVITTDHTENQTTHQGAPTPPTADPAAGEFGGDQPTTATVTADAGVAVADNYRVQLQDKNDLQKQNPALDRGRNTDLEESKKRDEVAKLDAKLEMNAKRQVADEKLAKESREGLAVAKKDPAKPKPQPQLATTTKAEPPKAKAPTKSSKGYIEVTTPDQAPKDFDSKVASGRGDTAKTTAQPVGGSTASRAPGNAGPRPTAPPPPPAIAVEQEKKPESKPADPMLAWAKEQHGKAIIAAKKDCKLAASIVMQIANRAPAYYSANIENATGGDRALKSCQQYIALEREKETERVNRAKATQRRATDEAPAPRPAETSK